MSLNFLLIVIFILAIFVISFLSSVVLTRLHHVGEVRKTTVPEILEKRFHRGIILDLEAAMELVRFPGLDELPVLIAREGSSQIQATVPDELSSKMEIGQTRLVPGTPEDLSGERENLGRFKMVATFQDFPTPHLKILAAKPLE